MVTGGASGIGEAIAKGYAKEGAHIVILDNNLEGAAAVVKEILDEGGEAWSFKLDVTNRNQCRQLAGQVAEKIGQTSILVNNAGINRRNAFTADADDVTQDWDDIIGINLSGVFNVTHAFVDQLARDKRADRQHRLDPILSSCSHAEFTGHTTSKHGVLGFTKALAAELGKDGVRVNAIGPGLIETPLNENARVNNPGLIQTFRGSHAARPHRQAGGYRGSGHILGFRHVGLCVGRHHHGRRWLPDGLGSLQPSHSAHSRERETHILRLSKD